MQTAGKESIITNMQRYGLHGLKHRGAIDTKGDKADKKPAIGHKTYAMEDLYDHDVPLVKPAGQHQFQGEF